MERLKVVPSLIIGLGGTGALGLLHARRKIIKRLRPHLNVPEIPRKVPFVEYLVLDTTAQGEAARELGGDEFLNLGHRNISRIIREIEKNPLYQRTLKWFPRHIRPGQIDSGARGIRHIGRLCFFLGKQDIERSIRSKIQNITNELAIDKALKEQFKNISIDPGSTIDVHLITSMCGGTGSACLLDTAYLVKHVIEDITKQGANVTAHLVTTEPFDCDRAIGPASLEYIHYNFAITLSEIERFTNFDISLTGAEELSADDRWEVEYMDGSIISSIEKPFSLTYLLGNKQGNSLVKSQVCEIIGEAIALIAAHPKGGEIKEGADNMKSHAINEPDMTGRMKSYSSYNIGILSAEFNDRILSMTYFIAGKTTLAALCGSGHTVSPTEDEFKEFETAVKVTDKGLKEKTELEVGVARERLNKFLDDLKPQINTASHRFYDHAPKEARRFRRKQSGQDPVALARQDFEGAKRKFGGEVGELTSKIKDWFAELNRRLDDQIDVLMQEGKSLRYISLLLDQAKAEVQRARADLSRQKDLLGTPDDFNEKLLQRAVNEREGQRFLGRWLDYEVFGGLFNSVDRRLEAVGLHLSERQRLCERSIKFLDELSSGLHQDGFKAVPLVVRSIWTPEIIKGQVEKKTPQLVKAFITRVKDAANDDKIIQNRTGEAFLKYLEPVSEREKRVAKLLETVAREIVEKDIRNELIDFDRDEHSGQHPELTTDDIISLVNSASPIWQIERGGEDVAQVSVTNCPKDSKLGDVIDRLKEGISLSENGNSECELVVFRSEHGASTSLMLNVRKCMRDLMQKLLDDNKEEINELSLDPRWRIKEPIAAESRDELHFYFSLGDRFDFIKRTLNSYFFFNQSGQEFPLTTQQIDDKSVRRYRAFEQFLTLRYKADKDIDVLIAKIQSRYEDEKQDKSVVKFRAAVQEQIEELKKRIEIEETEIRAIEAGDASDKEKKWRIKEPEMEKKLYLKEIAVLESKRFELDKYIGLKGLDK